MRAPTLGEFAQQFGGAYLSTEGALWRTLKLLLLKPGELTRQYLRGRRKHYVLPLRLYLTISVIVLLAMRLVTHVDMDGAPVEIGPTAQASIDLGFSRAGVKEGKFFCEGLPASICRRLERRYAVEPKVLAREFQQLGERFVANVGAAMFLLLPTFALWLKLFYWNRRLRYTEHLVFALHLHAFWFLMLGLMLVSLGWVEAAAFFAVPVYTLLAMRRVYGGRWWPLVLRAAAISVLYGIVLGVALAALAVVVAVV